MYSFIKEKNKNNIHKVREGKGWRGQEQNPDFSKGRFYLFFYSFDNKITKKCYVIMKQTSKNERNF